MRIGDREVGHWRPPYIIAEIGVNHDGSVDRAIELVEMAKRAGADAIKLQLFQTDRLLSRAAKLALYQKAEHVRDPFALLRRLELTIEQMTPVVAAARKLKLHAIVTVFSVELVDEAQRLSWDAYKVASPDIIHRPLIESLMRKGGGRPLLLSTGAATLGEIAQAAAWLGDHPHLFMQCVSAYPAPDDHAALAARQAIENITPHGLGYSDHTESVDSGALAVASGARVLEKHLTHDRRADGPDHAASLDPDGFAEYVRLAHRAFRMLGEQPPAKRVLSIERDVHEVSRQSITTARAVRAGHTLRREDVTIKRPGTGLPPYRLEAVMGATLRRDVEADMPLREEDLMFQDEQPQPLQSRRAIDVVTGTRAEYGLLRPVMRAIAARPELRLRVIATGTHLLPPHTINEVAADFDVAATVPMQSIGRTGRASDAEALGRGISGFAELWARDKSGNRGHRPSAIGHRPTRQPTADSRQPNSPLPAFVLVLGDRIEAFAAAAAAAVCGIRVAHLHGGDRAEGIADESLRHAISKLAHVHLAATQQSALRLIAMGERPEHVHIVGSPALDELSQMPPLDDDSYAALGSPQIIVLLHPTGDEEAVEQDRASELLRLAQEHGPTLALHPNHDPGRDGIVQAIHSSGCRSVEHLPRSQFIGLLRRAKVLVGNSSAGLIEAAAIPVRAINIGNRQSGREMPENVTDVPWAGRDYQTIRQALESVMNSPPLAPGSINHPYGDGASGSRAAELLAQVDLSRCPLAKRNSY